MVEFALVMTFVALPLVLGVADLARWYMSAIGVESATREAADYGAFKTSNWAPVNVGNTIDEMKRRACTAASNLTDYEGDPAGTAVPMACTNPTFSCELLLPDGTAVACASYSGTECSDNATEPPCRVSVTLGYTFHMFLVPTSINFSRQSTFAVSSLAVP